ncbi:hypothetical protein D3C75_885590 [compost metagenome]
MCQTDLRYQRRLPSWEPPEDREPSAVSAAQRAEEAQRPSLTPRDAPGDSGPRRNGAAERQYRCTTLFQGLHGGLTHRPAGCVQLLILDEYSRFLVSDSVTQADKLALLELYAQTMKPCPNSDGIRTCTRHPRQVGGQPVSQDRGLSERRTRAAPTPPGGRHLKTTVLTFTTTTLLTAAPLAVAQPRPAQPDRRAAGIAPTSTSNADVDRIESRPA